MWSKNMYELLVLVLVIVKTDNTAYQALVLVWLWCGNFHLVFLHGQRSVAEPGPTPSPSSILLSS